MMNLTATTKKLNNSNKICPDSTEGGKTNSNKHGEQREREHVVQV